MAGMHRETLRKHLHNSLLVLAIAQKSDVDKICKALRDTYSVLRKTKVSDAAQDEVRRKIDEYNKVGSNYGIMIEDTWGVTWQAESAIAKYIDCCDDDIDALPEYVS
jgi:myo-inositol catabolism protein IolC